MDNKEVTGLPDPIAEEIKAFNVLDEYLKDMGGLTDAQYHYVKLAMEDFAERKYASLHRQGPAPVSPVHQSEENDLEAEDRNTDEAGKKENRLNLREAKLIESFRNGIEEALGMEQLTPKMIEPYQSVYEKGQEFAKEVVEWQAEQKKQVPSSSGNSIEQMIIEAQIGTKQQHDVIQAHMDEYFKRWPNYKTRLNDLEWYHLFLDFYDMLNAAKSKPEPLEQKKQVEPSSLSEDEMWRQIISDARWHTGTFERDRADRMIEHFKNQYRIAKKAGVEPSTVASPVLVDWKLQFDNFYKERYGHILPRIVLDWIEQNIVNPICGGGNLGTEG